MFFRKKQEPVTEPSFNTGFADTLETLPIGVSLRRCQPRANGSRWCAQYFKGTKYYGKTAEEALAELLLHNDRASSLHFENGGPNWPAFKE